MTPSATSVLRIGPTDSNASAALLKTALLSHFETEDDEHDTLTVSNRYFSAKVCLKDVQQTITNDRITKEDGMILVFDALRSNPDVIGGTTNSSFDALTHVHNEAEAKDECGDLLRLCVGVSVGSKSPMELRGSKHEEEYSRRVLWCLDRGYEYLEADLSHEGQTTGHDERDKDGFARIVEAISGTVWSSAIMEKSKKQELKESYDKDKQSLTQVTETTTEKEENPYIPPDDYFVDDSKVTEQDKVMENLEGLLREASRIREASRAGEMSDDERRKRAADAATLMMNLMTQLDVDDDQENDFDVDSSSDEEEAINS